MLASLLFGNSQVLTNACRLQTTSIDGLKQ